VRREQVGRCVCEHGAALWLRSGVSRGKLDDAKSVDWRLDSRSPEEVGWTG
jgi:hypothetical protein